MWKINKIFVVILIIIVVLLVSFFGGVLFERSGQGGSKEVVSAKIIVDKINNEAFILTKTVFISQDVTITIDQGSDWSNFWW